MPEIIDLEVMRANMATKVVGKQCTQCEVPGPKVLRNTEVADLKDSVEGRVLNSVSRKAKALIFEFADSVKLAIHLMLHGDFCWKDDADKKKSIVLELEFGDSGTILLKDWSAWTKVELVDPEKNVSSDLLEHEVGVDPLGEGFSTAVLADILSRRSRSGIKAILMDQKEIAGIGNAYADEILWDAKIHPSSKCRKLLDDGLIDALHKSIGTVLDGALNIVQELSSGESISEQDREFMKVYRKSGSKCPRCGYMIEQTKVNSRDTFVCRKCQE